MAIRKTVMLGKCGKVEVGRKGGKYFIEMPGEKRSYKTKKLVEAYFRRACKRQKLLGFMLSGSGKRLRCRDSEGAFVPVSQCRGPVGRNKAGRFKSVK